MQFYSEKEYPYDRNAKCAIQALRDFVLEDRNSPDYIGFNVTNVHEAKAFRDSILSYLYPNRKEIVTLSRKYGTVLDLCIFDVDLKQWCIGFQGDNSIVHHEYLYNILCQDLPKAFERLNQTKPNITSIDSARSYLINADTLTDLENLIEYCFSVCHDNRSEYMRTIIGSGFLAEIFKKYSSFDEKIETDMQFWV